MRTLLMLFYLFCSLHILAQEPGKVQENLFIKQISLDSYKDYVNSTSAIKDIRNTNILSVYQKGNDNILKIKANSNDYQVVEQIGNRNYYHFTDYYNFQTSKMKIVQEGNSNLLHVFGTNSLSKNIKIYQKSDFKSIVVRNF